MGSTILDQNAGPRSPAAEAGLAREWALFQAVETGGADLLFGSWEIASPVVVVGRHGSLADVRGEVCREHHVPVLRRFSGGGAVVLGPGCVNYAVALSLVSRPDFVEVQAGFTRILAALVAALGVRGLAMAGSADLAIDDRKVSGNAQRRGRRALIHHGTLLYDFDATLASRYVNEPLRQPAYRKGRCHADFIGNLPLDGDTIRARLATAWRALAPDATRLCCAQG